MMHKQTLRRIHIRAGVILGLPFVILGVTGVLLIWEPDISGFSRDVFMRQAEPVPASLRQDSRLHTDTIVTAARQFVQASGQAEGAFPARLTAPEGEKQPYIIVFKAKGQKPWEEKARLMVTPGVERVAPTEEGELYRLLMRFHMHMGIPGAPGRNLVGGLGVALMLTGAIGAGLRLRSAIAPRMRWAPPLRAMPKAAMIRSLHGAGALWLGVPLLFAALTGVYLAWPWAARPLTLAVSPASRDLKAAYETIKSSGETPSPAVTAGVAAQAAEAALPGAHWRQIGFPVKPGDPWRVNLAFPEDGFPAVPSVVFVDAVTGAVLRAEDSRTFTMAEAFPAWMRQLHGASGAEAPLWLKLIFTMTGLALALLPVSGMMIYIGKKKA